MDILFHSAIQSEVPANGSSSTIVATASTSVSPPQSTSNSTANGTSACLGDTVLQPFFGLNWHAYCNSDVNGNWDLDSTPAGGIAECLESCTHTWGCYGASLFQGICYHKKSGVTSYNLISKPDVITILPDPVQINQTLPDQVVCPVTNLARQKTTSGLEFEILCGAMYDGDDLYEPFTDPHQFMHAENLQECIEHCADNHPLCDRVSWDADKGLNLWLNCWLKKSSPEIEPAISISNMRHSADAFMPILKQVECKNNSIQTAGGRTFKTSCMDFRAIDNATTPFITATHEVTIDNCMQRCVEPTSNCTSYLFDVGLQSGYRNCYLFDKMPPPKQQSRNYTFVYLETLSDRYVAPPPNPHHSSFTRAEIALSVTMPLTALLILFAIYWFWYRRQRDKKIYFPVKSD